MSSPHTDWDLLITDNNEECFENIVKVNGTLLGINQLQPHYIETNYNFADELIDAISLLIENAEHEHADILPQTMLVLKRFHRTRMNQLKMQLQVIN